MNIYKYLTSRYLFSFLLFNPYYIYILVII